MAGDGGGDRPSRINRREALKRTAIATGVAWSAPILTSLRTPAYAQYPPGPDRCEEGCTYVILITNLNGTFTCSECTGSEDQCSACPTRTCAGPACARVVSITETDNTVRVCLDCEASSFEDPEDFFIYRCLDGTFCGGARAFYDDPRCVQLPKQDFHGCQGNEQWELQFQCLAC
jgi:hypothetical protein